MALTISAEYIEGSLGEINALQEEFVAAQENLEGCGQNVEVLAREYEALVDSTGKEILRGFAHRVKELGGDHYLIPLGEEGQSLLINRSGLAIVSRGLILTNTEYLDPSQVLGVAPLAVSVLGL